MILKRWVCTQMKGVMTPSFKVHGDSRYQVWIAPLLKMARGAFINPFIGKRGTQGAMIIATPGASASMADMLSTRHCLVCLCSENCRPQETTRYLESVKRAGLTDDMPDG